MLALLLTLAQEAAPYIVPEVKRLYKQWSETGVEPTPAEYDALLARVTENNLRKLMQAEADRLGA